MLTTTCFQHADGIVCWSGHLKVNHFQLATLFFNLWNSHNIIAKSPLNLVNSFILNIIDFDKMLCNINTVCYDVELK